MQVNCELLILGSILEEELVSLFEGRLELRESVLEDLALEGKGPRLLDNVLWVEEPRVELILQGLQTAGQGEDLWFVVFFTRTKGY